ncbi:MAG: DNA-deoxyinosine glycosylase [Treponema sp.]|nr:DNA-deoxyinosine glycosylase [Treponema sp.]
MPDSTLITHPLPPVCNAQSKVLLLGTMPSPKSRELGFFYMHPQNRFWRVLPQVFGESLALPNKAPDTKAAIQERRDFLLRHKLALWDVLASCQIEGAADSSIRQEIPNDFTKIFSESKICHVFFTGQTAAALWKKHCKALYEERFNLTVHTLPSTSPANARFTLENLIEEYQIVKKYTLD